MNRRDISDLMIERYLLDELPADRKEQIDRLRSTDTELDRKIESISKENEVFFREHPSDLFVERIKRQAERERQEDGHSRRNGAFDIASILSRVLNGFTVRNIVSVGAAAMVVALVFVYTPFNTGRVSVPDRIGDEGIRLKGGPSLMIYKKEAQGTTLLGDGAKVEAGDRIQLFYRNPGYEYGVIFSIDGDGTVTQHLPISGGTSAHLDESTRVMLPNSYTLDDAPAFEKFYFFASSKPFHVDYVINAVKDAGLTDTVKLKRNELSYSVYTLQKAE
ncbi:MAG: hypothetical protein ACOC2H_04000 [Spirochaetota bacterium]